MDAGWSLFVAPFLIYFAYRIILLLFQCVVHNKFDDGMDVRVPLVLVYLLKLIRSPIKNFKMFVHGFFPGISEKYWPLDLSAESMTSTLSTVILPVAEGSTARLR